MMMGDMSEWGDKKILCMGGRRSTMDDAMYLRPDKCILEFLNSD